MAYVEATRREVEVRRAAVTQWQRRRSGDVPPAMG
jgi:hypothetical protein